MNNMMNIDLDLIRKAFEDANVPVRFVGGCVRDLLLGITPKDWDMATPALPEDILSILKAANINAFDMSNGHGTITAVINNEAYEITTLRQDLETDGRHAVVGFTDSWEVDAERRDFTFNALSMDWDGTIYDYFNGIKDLQEGEVNFVGDADLRMQEDYLRILRFFRFLGRMPKPKADVMTLAKISENRAGLKNISGERIWSEMKKILAGENVEYILSLMDSTKVLGAIDIMMNVTGIPSSKDPVTNLAAVIDENFVSIVIDRWKLSKQEQKNLEWLVDKRDIFFPVSAMESALVNGVDRSLVLELTKLRNDKLAYDHLKNWEIPVFPVTGNDLIASGVAPGPKMGTILQLLKNTWIAANYIPTKDRLLLEAQSFII